MNGKSPNIAEEKLARLKELLPEAFSEGKVDWEKLRVALGDEVEFKDERYHLNWAGKTDAFRVLQSPTTATLRPCREESMDFDDSDNLFIEGENLEVLKVLQKSYFGKVRMIYIDPPYNTGNDHFIYPDRFAESKDAYLKRIGDKDEQGRMTREGMFRKNSRENGHFHSNWLSMIYPRLFLARNLLCENGVIFVSIDDNEVHNLKMVMNEIFGEENFIGCAGRITKKSNNKGDYWSPNFDYLLTYTKNIEAAESFFGGVNTDAYNITETEGVRSGERYQLVRLYMSTIQNRNPEQRFWIDCPDGQNVIPPGTTFPPERPNLGDGIWRWTRRKFEAERDKIVIRKVQSSNLVTKDGCPARWNVFTKTYLQDVIDKSSAKPNSFIENHINQNGSHELGTLKIPFDYPKPSSLIYYLMEVSKVKESDIVLDFFAGSATTAHAVLQLNAKDGGNRKFICIQMPEPCDEKSEAHQSGYKTIADIGKERIRRVIKKDDLKDGFKVFKLQKSNLKTWRGEHIRDEQELEKQLKIHITPLVEDAETEHVLYELLLKSGLSLTSEIEDKGNWFLVRDFGTVIALALERIDDATIKTILAVKPQSVITLDHLFKNNDQLKTNTALLMEDAGIEFRTI